MGAASRRPRWFLVCVIGARSRRLAGNFAVPRWLHGHVKVPAMLDCVGSVPITDGHIFSRGSDQVARCFGQKHIQACKRAGLKRTLPIAIFDTCSVDAKILAKTWATRTVRCGVLCLSASRDGLCCRCANCSSHQDDSWPGGSPPKKGWAGNLNLSKF